MPCLALRLQLRHSQDHLSPAKERVAEELAGAQGDGWLVGHGDVEDEDAEIGLTEASKSSITQPERIARYETAIREVTKLSSKSLEVRLPYPKRVT